MYISDINLRSDRVLITTDPILLALHLHPS